MKIKIFTIATTLLCISCNNSYHIDNYVYVDIAAVIHTDPQCLSKTCEKKNASSETQEICMRGLQYIDKSRIFMSEYTQFGKECHERQYRYCSRCVDSKAHKDILDLQRQNEINYRNMIDLYEDLCKEYEKMEGFNELLIKLDNLETREIFFKNVRDYLDTDYEGFCESYLNISTNN